MSTVGKSMETESKSWATSPGLAVAQDMTERLHVHFSLSCIGEGNGNPLQCSCLENPRDRGAWWAAVYGVAQSRTRLKWLSSSSRAGRVDRKLYWLLMSMGFLWGRWTVLKLIVVTVVQFRQYVKTTELYEVFFFFLFWLCHIAYQILVPQPGIKPMLPAVGSTES